MVLHPTQTIVSADIGIPSYQTRSSCYPSHPISCCYPLSWL
jgi:hypothetical protein